jgi:hypothetical protein
MLVFNPYFLLYDVGFVLSFSAIIGLVWMQSYQEKNKIEKEKILQKKGITKKKLSRYDKTKNYIFQSYLSPTL